MWNMIRVATAGVQAQQRALEVAANNLANAQTTAFKAQRAELTDLPPRPAQFAVGGDGSPIQTEERELGQGTMLTAVLANHSQGPVSATGRPLDVAIAGDGLLAVTLPDGQAAYTRDGALRLDSDRRLVTASGALLAPPIAVPPDARGVTLDAAGRVVADLGDGQSQVVGQVQLTRFTNPDGLLHVGESLLVATAAAGTPTSGTPGQDGFGALVPGSLEGSNVDVGNELVRTMQAQRAYQMNLRTLRTLDKMLQAASNLQR